MSFFGVELNSQINRLLLQIRLKLAQNKVLPNFRTIYRSFANFDNNISGLVALTSFEKALNQNGFFFKHFEIQAFQKAFGTQQGLVNWFSFLHHLKQPMSPDRREIISGIFLEIAGGKNQATVAQLKEKFVSESCDSFEKVFKDNKGTFDRLITLMNVQNSMVTKEEFLAYYDDLSINFPSDQAFARYACSQWRSKEKKVEKWNEQRVKQALKALRFKLIQKTQGTKDEFLIKKLFTEFARNTNGSIGTQELDLILKRVELPTEQHLVVGLLEVLDKNKSGYIQYDEFKKFIFFDPFPK